MKASSKFLSALILNSEDPHNLAEFYQGIFDLPFTKRGDDFSCILGETHFAIHKVQKGKKPTCDVELGIYISHLDDFVKGLNAKKVKIVDPIREYPWARSATIKDPQGNVIYLMQLPQESLDNIKAQRSLNDGI